MLLQDIHYTLRQLRKSPGFTALAIITLAVGIGVNAAMFTILSATLLRPLPYAHGNRIMAIQAKNTISSTNDIGLTYPEVLDWQREDRDFQQFAYYSSFPATIDEKSTSDLVIRVAVSSNLFDLLGVQPILGRTLTSNEQQAGRGNLVILPERLWRDKFNGDPGILGKTLRLGAQPYTVIGVMPAHFAFPIEAGHDEEVWVPMELTPSILSGSDRTLNGVGLLRPQSNVETATRNLTQIQGRLSRQDSTRHPANAVMVESYRNSLTNDVRGAMVALACAVALVWLIACANIAGLMLARITGRARELSIRVALGAGRGRLLGQLLTETLFLSALGCMLAIVLSQAALMLLRQVLERQLPFEADFNLSLPVLAGLVAATLVSALVVGIVPALHASAIRVQSLHESSARAGTSRRQTRVRDVFVIAQVALSVVLLVSAGLMLRTIYSLRNVPLGFQTERLMTTMFFIPQQQYATRNIGAALYRPLLADLRAVPGVDSAAISSVLPVSTHASATAEFDFPDRPKPAPSQRPQAAFRATSPGLFRLLGIPLLEGRMLRESDNANTAPVAVVNQEFVRRYFPHENPLGHPLRLARNGPHAVVTICGVVGNVHQAGLSTPPAPEIDIPYAEMQPGDDIYPFLSMFMQLAVRTRYDPKAVIPEIRRTLHTVNPDLGLTEFQTMQEQVDESLDRQTLAGRLLGLFAAIALLIAGGGLYALLAYSVTQRTREIGIRMALGAERARVLAMVFRHASAVTATGIAIGIVASWFAVRAFETYLFGVPKHDAATMAVVAALLLVVSVSAALLPARSAASVDPIIALRQE